jgi:hypothetical protein
LSSMQLTNGSDPYYVPLWAKRVTAVVNSFLGAS